MANIDEFIQNLFYRATDDDPEVSDDILIFTVLGPNWVVEYWYYDECKEAKFHGNKGIYIFHLVPGYPIKYMASCSFLIFPFIMMHTKEYTYLVSVSLIQCNIPDSVYLYNEIYQTVYYSYNEIYQTECNYTMEYTWQCILIHEIF